MKKKQDNRVASLVVVIAVIVLAAIFYLLNQNTMDRRGDIVGDRICGDFVEVDAQDGCCGDVHKGEIHALCEGKWEYVEGVRKCQYVCIGTLPSCSEDFRVCESGDVVGRNPEYECEFNNCP
jgi:hypothetical protein